MSCPEIGLPQLSLVFVSCCLAVFSLQLKTTKHMRSIRFVYLNYGSLLFCGESSYKLHMFRVPRTKAQDSMDYFGLYRDGEL